MIGLCTTAKQLQNTEANGNPSLPLVSKQEYQRYQGDVVLGHGSN